MFLCSIFSIQDSTGRRSVGKRTPTEYWAETLNKTGVGYTAQTAKHNSFTGKCLYYAIYLGNPIIVNLKIF